ncbi:MAG: putative thioredoxin [Candidatus Poriferisodalaceae bacterium]|jgi:putative thioredoxin
MMIDVTDATFNEEVIERSKQAAVVIDLWAPWCGPCKTLGPILDTVIDEFDGAVVGVKINIDENPEIAQAFQVQSIPMVVAFKDGESVDGFMGAQGEPMVRDFISKLVPTPEENQLDALVEAGDETSLLAALEIESDHVEGVTKLADLMVADGRGDEAIALMKRIPESPETRRIAALARTGDLAETDEVNDELATLLTKVKTDDDARQRFVDLLEVMGADDPRTAGWRKKLSGALF